MKKILLLSAIAGFTFGKAQIFTENFNAAASLPSGWTVSNSSGTDQWGVGNSAFYESFSSNVAFFDDDAAGSSSINSAATITSPIINLAAFPNAKLSFKFVNFQYDAGTVKAEVYNGTSWVQVFLFSDDNYDYDSNYDVLLTQVSDISLAGYTNADFRIRFIYDDGGDWSFGCAVDDIVISDGILATSESVLAKQDIEIYPTVTTEYINIKSKDKIKKTTVFDMSGKIMKVTTDDNKVNVQSLHAGSYIINLETEKGKTSKKFIKK